MSKVVIVFSAFSKYSAFCFSTNGKFKFAEVEPKDCDIARFDNTNITISDFIFGIENFDIEVNLMGTFIH